MTLLQSILLGIVQGLTEFLPISSSGHLVLIPALFGWKIPPDIAFVFDVLVQDATLVAVVIYFWKDLVGLLRGFFRGLARRQPFAEPESRLAWLLILATIPAGLFGLFVKDTVESAFGSTLFVGGALIFTAALLTVAEYAGRRSKPFDCMNWKDALVIGLFQALSIFPGVSRSGSSIAGGMLRNLERPAAARFSFLMSVPIMIAAGLLTTLDLVRTPGWADLLPIFLPGFVTAGVVGYFAIRWLLAYLARKPLTPFAIYCVIVGLATILLSLQP